MIPKEKIDEIHDIARIEEVVGDFVALRKRGVNLLGLCPFHQEKTPSFTVSPSKGIYKCFGCGASGNSVGFIMQHEHYSYPEALKYLATKYGIEIQEEELDAEAIKAQNEKESLMSVTSFAQSHFVKTLWESKEGRTIGLSYLKERGFTDSTIETFQLGYSSEQWADLTQAAEKAGYKKEFLEKSGLSIYKTNQAYDRFRTRVIFPIHNLTGRVIGFGGRILTQDKTNAKYLNSPESEIYSKRKVLYGIYFAKTDIVRQNKCFLVEGYTDVISLHQRNIKNVVASSGTALTQEQIRLIKRYTQNITILFDGDSAGIKASFRGIDMILEQGMNVRIVLLPEGEDPDSFSRNNSDTAINEYLSTHEQDFIGFKASLLLNDTQKDPILRSQAIEEIAQSIALVPDMLLRDEFIKSAWETVEVSQETLAFRIADIRRKKGEKKLPQYVAPTNISDTIPEQENATNKREHQLENYLIKAILLYGQNLIDHKNEEGTHHSISVAEYIINEIAHVNYSFFIEENRIVFNAFQTAVAEGYIPTLDDFKYHHDPAIQQHVISITTETHELSKNWREKKQIYVIKEHQKYVLLVHDLLFEVQSRSLEKEISRIEEVIKTAQESHVIELLHEYKTLRDNYANINRKRSRIITK